jgi:hypothetical protein
MTVVRCGVSGCGDQKSTGARSSTAARASQCPVEVATWTPSGYTVEMSETRGAPVPSDGSGM